MGVLDIFRKTAPDDRALTCPRDGREMSKVARDGVVVDRCGGCGGHWLDARELKRVANDADVEKAAAWVGAYAQTSPFACPRCAAKCYESFVEEVRVDTCGTCHGVWLDKGELDEAKRQTSVQRLVRSGGPDLRAFLRKL